MEEQELQHLPGQFIHPLEQPTEPNWSFNPLYKRGQDDKIHVWQVAFDASTNQLLVQHGHKDGKLQLERVDVKIVSKATYEEQALLLARKRNIDKVREGYKSDMYVNIEGILPQLAEPYHPPGSTHPTNGKNLKSSISDEEFPVWIQVKLNGIRAIVSKEVGDSIVFTSRQGLDFPWLTEIRKEYATFFKYLPNGIGIDGELYTRELTFRQIQSAVRSKKYNPDNVKLVHHIFDLVYPNYPLVDRFKLLINAYKAYLEDGNVNKYFIILNHENAYSNEDIINLRDDAISKDYEGIVIRFPCLNQVNKEKSFYTGFRNNNLLKFKQFIDDEGLVTGVIDGKGRDKGLAIFVMEARNGAVFKCKPSEPFSKRKEWFEHPEKCINKIYTYKHVKPSAEEDVEGYVPQHNTGIGFRDEKDLPRDLPERWGKFSSNSG